MYEIFYLLIIILIIIIICNINKKKKLKEKYEEYDLIYLDPMQVEENGYRPCGMCNFTENGIRYCGYRLINVI